MRKAVDSGEHSRTSLARGLCEVEDWRNSAGELCLASARKVLPRLADSLGLVLPTPRPRPDGGRPLDAYPDVTLSCRLQELGDVKVEPVVRTEVTLWRSMMASHHPQGERRQPGARLLYWIVSSRRGRLGGFSFCAASWHQCARDTYLDASRAGSASGQDRQQRPFSGPARRSRAVARLACARSCTVSPCRRLAGGLWGPSGASLHLCGCREDGQLLRGRGLGSVRENDGPGPVGLDEAALRGLAGSPARADAPRTRAAALGDSRLGGDGVWSIHPSRRTAAHPADRHGAAMGGKSGRAGLRDFPATRRTEGGVSVSVERTGDDGRHSGASPGSVDGTLQTGAHGSGRPRYHHAQLYLAPGPTTSSRSAAAGAG